ncbi:DUF1904 family protein [Paenibacillus thalictri]|uniref:DUF1904 family protein n=2 Tax=Paenibacillus thalictri TaxID=2527873 RepID=A0A4Q9DR52_9BACL|nr:DUF1904 family protein [Paenibacillus thalictri]TBL76641.1 DUF1904 family protein [Paenibacillus thalictri]
MPFLRFQGFTQPFLKSVASEIIAEFAHMIHIPEQIVKLSLDHAENIANVPPTLEISMFPRSQDKHDAVASAMHSLLSKYGFHQVHIYFILLSPSLYYKEGKPLITIPEATYLESH